MESLINYFVLSYLQDQKFWFKTYQKAIKYVGGFHIGKVKLDKKLEKQSGIYILHTVY